MRTPVETARTAPPRLNFLFPLSPTGATETSFNRPDGAQTTEENGRIASPFVPRACAAWLLTVALAGLTKPGRVPGSRPARIPTPAIDTPGASWIPPLRPGVYPPVFRWRAPPYLRPSASFVNQGNLRNLRPFGRFRCSLFTLHSALLTLHSKMSVCAFNHTKEGHLCAS